MEKTAGAKAEAELVRAAEESLERGAVLMVAAWQGPMLGVGDGEKGATRVVAQQREEGVGQMDLGPDS